MLRGLLGYQSLECAVYMSGPKALNPKLGLSVEPRGKISTLNPSDRAEGQVALGTAFSPTLVVLFILSKTLNPSHENQNLRPLP